jgi:hypothetical protein
MLKVSAHGRREKGRATAAVSNKGARVNTIELTAFTRVSLTAITSRRTLSAESPHRIVHMRGLTSSVHGYTDAACIATAVKGP